MDKKRSAAAAEDAANIEAALAATNTDLNARKAEKKVVAQRTETYLAEHLPKFDASAPAHLKIGLGARVLEVADDGNCIPRAALTAACLDYGNENTSKLRANVILALRENPSRYFPLLAGSTGGAPWICQWCTTENGGLDKLCVRCGVSRPAIVGDAKESEIDDKKRSVLTSEETAEYEAHVKRMAQPGIFFEDPEFQALADVLSLSIAVDAVVVHSGSIERRVFEPNVTEIERNGIVLLLSVCTANASHCEAVVSADIDSGWGGDEGFDLAVNALGSGLELIAELASSSSSDSGSSRSRSNSNNDSGSSGSGSSSGSSSSRSEIK